MRKPLLLARSVVMPKSGMTREVGWMKITIELGDFALKALLALSLAAWCGLESQPVAGAVMALAAVWKA